MYNKIVSYYSNINVNTILNKIIIEGENINYIITTNTIENSDSDSYLLNLGENCINTINEITSDYYIVLINVINTDYATSSNGIRIFNNNNERYLLSNLCNKQTINIGIPIEATTSEITLYKKIKNEYGYDLISMIHFILIYAQNLLRMIILIYLCKREMRYMVHIQKKYALIYAHIKNLLKSKVKYIALVI